VSCHDKIVQMAMQKQRQQRVSRQPIDFIPLDGSVRVTQSLICGSNLILIDFLMHYGFVRAAEGNKPNRPSWLQCFLWRKAVMVYDNKVCLSVGLACR
jgi:hypothetical protein